GAEDVRIVINSLASTFNVTFPNQKKQRACTQHVPSGLTKYRSEADFTLEGGNISVGWIVFKFHFSKGTFTGTNSMLFKIKNVTAFSD
uniref:Uncharacterized protein n=1 Tax=Athene cunicularia TaxID=194338 RepID=A0A663MBP8_ATHCN